MSEIIEKFFNGYCKNYDMSRSMIGEFRRDGEKLVLEQIDCGDVECIHRQNCELMKKVSIYEKEFGK